MTSSSLDPKLVETAKELAFFSVGRACLFGMLAIATVVLGLVAWPAMALKAGGFLTGIGGAVLVYRASQARQQSFKRTEVWVLIREKWTAADEHAQAVISQALAETYWRFAEYAAALTLVQLAFGMALWWLGARALP